jgi:hypothetical protein
VPGDHRERRGADEVRHEIGDRAWVDHAELRQDERGEDRGRAGELHGLNHGVS